MSVDAEAAASTKEYDPRPDLAYSRTHLANQRTYAAWLRTGLSIAAAGVALAHLLPTSIVEPVIALAFGTTLVFMGIVAIVFGAWSFRRTSRTLAGHGSPPALATKLMVYASAAIMSALLMAGVLLV